MPNPKGIRNAGRDIYTVNFADYLPGALKQDPKIKAIAEAVTKEALTISGEIENVLIYSRIDELPEALIDILAYDMHVDWYDYSFPLKVKRDILKGSVKVHKKMGTKYAVEKALDSVYPCTTVEEWFDYGGNPFCFRLRINGEYNTQINIPDILEKLLIYKRMSAHLDTICIWYNILVIIRCENAVRAKMRFWPRQNLEYSYLNGICKLNGTRRLNGYATNAGFELYPLHSVAEIQMPIKRTILLETRMRRYVEFFILYKNTVRSGIQFYPRQNLKYAYLNGRSKLNGSKYLNGYITNTKVELYPIQGAAIVWVPVQYMINTNNINTKISVKVNKLVKETACTTISAKEECNHKLCIKSVSDGANVVVCAQDEYVKIHGCLDGKRKLSGSRKLNAGRYKL